VSDIVDNFKLKWLPIDIENRVAIDVKLEHVSAVDSVVSSFAVKKFDCSLNCLVEDI
jgi:hypothetical protein